MNDNLGRPPAPDQGERDTALDCTRSVLVRAPAGSGKTTLLAERFLCLLAQVQEPGQVVAITFTEAAAAEMRNRILDELRKTEPTVIARRVLEHSVRLGWKLLELPAQLRISTIDAFCRVLALQQPLVSGLGGGLEIAEHPDDLYRRAARRTLEQIGKGDLALSEAIEHLLLWRDNNWKEIEDLLARMLENRDRWMHDFVLDRNPDWDALREALERPFVRSGDASLQRYTDSEWQIVCACFRLLRHAAGVLQVVFAETGRVDFTEVAQIALRVLKGDEGQPSDATLAIADGIRHLLVDEFQDTSRRQHQLLAHLISAWPDRDGRTCFVVGDPMQSIYGFRDADAELFPRVERFGLEIPDDQPFRFDTVQLAANFRSAPDLVERLNRDFRRVFAEDDGSGVRFTRALPARKSAAEAGIHLVEGNGSRVQLHVAFSPQTPRGAAVDAVRKREIKAEQEEIRERQVQEVVAVIRDQLARVEGAHPAGEKCRVAVLGRTRKALAPIAAALRAAGIPFRAVELEQMQERPEILDALALTRALLNPQDRVGWLGVLRAPWCGLALTDLHTLTSADDPALLRRPVLELITERKHLLGNEGRNAVERIVNACEFAQAQRAAEPTVSTGSWLEQVWLRLGGAQCVDAAARANLDLLWSRIDALPESDQDLLGSSLVAALEKLNALPDPNADPDHGVQLMTIHKSKGLEFEVVIVPELQAGAGRGSYDLLSWLERGLAHSDDAEEVTEFLVAPLQPKGAERSAAKEFVDRARREREKQELRRLLYVAATRSREELHFFAQPEYKITKNGALQLAATKDTLLATASPAFASEIRRRFNVWCAKKSDVDDRQMTIDFLAASSVDDAGLRSPSLLRRLPANFTTAAAPAGAGFVDTPLLGTGRLYERHEGGLLSRVLGQVVHLLLQQLAQLLATQPEAAALVALDSATPKIVAQIRAAGVDAKQASRTAQQALEIARRAASDPIGRWILAPHPSAESEVRWTGVIDGTLRTVQVDRVFQAGDTPRSEPTVGGTGTWWIVDYKTAHEEGLDRAAALLELRRAFAPQIEAYAKVLRNLHGETVSLRAGLYYPRMELLDSWEL